MIIVYSPKRTCLSNCPSSRPQASHWAASSVGTADGGISTIGDLRSHKIETCLDDAFHGTSSDVREFLSNFRGFYVTGIANCVMQPTPPTLAVNIKSENSGYIGCNSDCKSRLDLPLNGSSQIETYTGSQGSYNFSFICRWGKSDHPHQILDFPQCPNEPSA